MKRVFIILGVFLFLAGCSDSVDIDGEKVDYDELQDKIAEKEKELDNIKDSISDAESNLTETESDLSKKKEEFDELISLKGKEEELQSKIDESSQQVDDINEKVQERMDKLESLEDEIETMEGKVVKAKDDPIKLQPGTYYFGTDIEPGRYKVTYQNGQHGNIYFHGAESFAQTFGNDSTQEYTFTAHVGEDIQFDIAGLLYPVE